MVELFHAINALLNAHKNKVLLIAEASLPESQYKAFRKLYLDETGERGLLRELKNLLLKQHGMDRNGRE